MTPPTDDSREFRPMRGISNRHLQTMLPRLIRRKVKFDAHWQRLELPDGDFVDINGNVIGRHHGIIRYTNGQRKGLGVAFGKPMYVADKNIEKNTVTLCTNDELFSREVNAVDFNLLVPDLPNEFKCKARVRYNMKEQGETAYLDGDKLKLIFDEPQRAITKGQAVVLYDGDTVIGGGTII